MQKVEISTFNGKINETKIEYQISLVPHDKYKFGMKS
jgi:hypothetical protein